MPGSTILSTHQRFERHCDVGRTPRGILALGACLDTWLVGGGCGQGIAQFHKVRLQPNGQSPPGGTIDSLGNDIDPEILQDSIASYPLKWDDETLETVDEDVSRSTATASELVDWTSMTNSSENNAEKIAATRVISGTPTAAIKTKSQELPNVEEEQIMLWEAPKDCDIRARVNISNIEQRTSKAFALERTQHNLKSALTTDSEILTRQTTKKLRGHGDDGRDSPSISCPIVPVTNSDVSVPGGIVPTRSLFPRSTNWSTTSSPHDAPPTAPHPHPALIPPPSTRRPRPQLQHSAAFVDDFFIKEGNTSDDEVDSTKIFLGIMEIDCKGMESHTLPVLVESQILLIPADNGGEEDQLLVEIGDCRAQEKLGNSSQESTQHRLDDDGVTVTVNSTTDPSSKWLMKSFTDEEDRDTQMDIGNIEHQDDQVVEAYSDNNVIYDNGVEVHGIAMDFLETYLMKSNTGENEQDDDDDAPEYDDTVEFVEHVVTSPPYFQCCASSKSIHGTTMLSVTSSDNSDAHSGESIKTKNKKGRHRRILRHLRCRLQRIFKS